MKAKVWVETSQEVEVDISASDMVAALAELPSTDQMPFALNALNVCYGVISRIPAALVGQMNDKQLAYIANALEEQAKRYLAALDGRFPAGGKDG